uniref:Uncharacterized protein n=1 Tax=Varanus komodoensis TaxID=61221 RepID=A0A8D2J7A0_VARKO
METTVLNIRNLFDQLMRQAEILNEGNELRKLSPFVRLHAHD